MVLDNVYVLSRKVHGNETTCETKLFIELRSQSKSQNRRTILTELQSRSRAVCVLISVAEPHHLYAPPAPGKNFDTAPAAPALAPTLLYSKAKFLK
jgi:hypothetical protein